MTEPDPNLARLEGDRIALPGLASAHSHAFQRALRGRTHRRTSGPGSFWSWRDQMYALAQQLTPESIYAISRFAYTELALAGVTAVGEFHYVHHDAQGQPYADRTVLADTVIRAARDVGLRITLLRVVYERSAPGVQAAGVQQRFCDASIDLALRDTETLVQRWSSNDHVRIGVAPHSLRAVSRPWVQQVATFAAEHALPVHMHVSEQRKDVDACRAEHGQTPVALLAQDEVLSDRFVAVHATHLAPGEADLLADARAFVCLCRTTERDLGDGCGDAASLTSRQIRVCAGADSHAISDPFEELRAIELDARTRSEQRGASADGTQLLRAGSEHGYAALGFEGAHQQDQVTLAADDPALAGVPSERLDDAVVFAAPTRAIRQLTVAGRCIVEEGHHPSGDAARRGYEAALAQLG